MQTIRVRLLVIILSVIALAWVALIPLTQSQTREQIDALMDQRAEFMADTLIVILEGEVQEGGTSGLAPQNAGVQGPVHHYESEPPFPFQLWIEGELRAHTISMPDFEAPTIESPAWQEHVVDRVEWRVHTRHKVIDSSGRGGPVNSWAVVGIRKDDLNTLAESLVWRASWPLFVSLPLLAITVFFGIGVGLRPLRDLAKQVSLRTPRQLKPVGVEHIPGEVTPLVDALNHLFEEVQRTITNEKRFTADAAHELRTPLSALSAQAHVALRAEDDISRQKALRQIISSVERLTHLVSQLLTLARLDPEIEVVNEQVNIERITTEVMADVGAEAIAKNLDFGFLQGAPVNVRGDATLLAIMIRNLLDNAIKYTPPNGQVSVSITNHGYRSELEIADTGPGIPPEKRSQVFQRFFRLATADGYGIGLGLSIVNRVATLHGATIEFRDRDGPGVIAVVSFPTIRNRDLAAA